LERAGWIKDYRKELDSDIWSMPPLYHRIWQYLKYSVNHANNEIPMRDGTKFQIHKSKYLTSYRNIAKGVGWYDGKVWHEPNPKTIKKICDWLEKNEMIQQKHGSGNREYTLVTLLNWELYQGKEAEEVTQKKQQVLTEVTPGKQLLDINKNDIKNDFKNDEEFIPPKPKKFSPKKYNLELGYTNLNNINEQRSGGRIKPDLEQGYN